MTSVTPGDQRCCVGGNMIPLEGLQLKEHVSVSVSDSMHFGISDLTAEDQVGH